MYKTIRHGENSLQYTILPQHDGIDGRQIVAKHRRKRDLLTYFIGFCIIVIVGGALIVSMKIGINRLVQQNPAWFETSNKMTMHVKERLYEAWYGKNVTDVLVQHDMPVIERKHLMINESIENAKNAPDSNAALIKITQNDLNASNEIIKTSIPPKITITSTLASIQRETTQFTPAWDRVFTASERHSASLKAKATPANMPIMDLNTESTSNVDKSLKINELISPSVISTTITTTSTTTTSTTTKATKSAANDNSEINVVVHELNVSKQVGTKPWIKSYWPFVDSSTYFQWTNYESEDNILLPVIFCGSVAAIIVFAIICIITKNKKCCCCRKRVKDHFLVN